MLSYKNRFRFWRVFWVVLACYVFFMFLGILAILTTNHESYNWDSFWDPWHFINQGVYMAASIGFFYFTLNYYYYVFAERKSSFHFLRYSILAGAIYALVMFAKLKFVPSPDSRREVETPAMFVFVLSLYTAMHIGASLLIAYLTYLRDEKKRQKVLEEQKMQLEVEKSSANLNFLKAQINPHFLHNTLNFLYAKSLPYSPELSEGILTLSDIMRYALSEGNARDGKAPLKDEVEHVWNVIKINQLRFSNKLNVDFKVEGLVNGVFIIPFVLITIVENAFKHGDLKSQEHPIFIRLDVGNNNLRFSCTNKKKTGPKELSTGVGLENIRKRLDLAYGKNYRFEVKDEQDFYTTELTIDRL